VLHGLGWTAAIVTTVVCVTSLWKRSRRSLAVTATALSLLSAAAIAAVDWRSLYVRGFYREHRQDFVAPADRVRRGGPPSGDMAGGPTLPTEMAYLSGNGRVGTMILQETGRRVLFVPAGTARGCIYPGVELSFDVYDGCASRMPLADGWYWTD